MQLFRRLHKALALLVAVRVKAVFQCWGRRMEELINHVRKVSVTQGCEKLCGVTISVF